ncbi:MAG TPA: hypothetical protein VEB60_02450 [Candidatus Paceibacterota bacterium]|nr:hypothetical protein [Candidatus Paceibacterota bacterium]
MASWSVRRRIAYFTAVAGFFALTAFSYYLVYKPKPTCFDGIKNQNEVGVDCGGACTLACRVQLSPLKPLWVRPLEVSKGIYDVAVLVENANQNFGARSVGYTIRVFDDRNVTIREKKGKIYVNPGQRFVIFEPRIETGERVAKRAFVTFDQTSLPWERLTVARPEISVVAQPFKNGSRPSLAVSLTNTTALELRDVDVAAVLSDQEQNALGASASYLKSLRPGETKEVVFTWPHEFVQEPSFIDVYPTVNMFELE